MHFLGVVAPEGRIEGPRLMIWILSDARNKWGIFKLSGEKMGIRPNFKSSHLAFAHVDISLTETTAY